jgi:ribose/xylose/arabinose/galactoside ABC-type transport system permease subunit
MMQQPEALLTGDERRFRLPRFADWAIWLVLLCLLGVGALLSDAMLRPANLVNILRQAAPLGIAALGVTFVMILGEVDLAVGAVISMSAVIAASLMDGSSANLVPAIATSLFVSTAIGALNGSLVAFSRVSSFILTLATAIVLYGCTQILTGGMARGAASPGFREFFNLRLGGWAPVLALAFLGLALIALVVQQTTTFSRQVYLIGANRIAARLSGLPIARTIIVAYMVSGFLGGVAGLALIARSGVSGSLAASGYEFDVLAAVILGGTSFQGGRGGIGGTVGGVLILTLAFNLVNIIGLNYHSQLIVKGLIIIIASATYQRIGARQRG